MVQAIWNGTVLADSSETVVVEGNHYFPRAHVVPDLLQESRSTSTCAWKGTARYYDVVAGDKINSDAAWFYPDPKPDASQIRDKIAFWKGVRVK